MYVWISIISNFSMLKNRSEAKNNNNNKCITAVNCCINSSGLPTDYVQQKTDVRQPSEKCLTNGPGVNSPSRAPVTIPG